MRTKIDDFARIVVFDRIIAVIVTGFFEDSVLVRTIGHVGRELIGKETFEVFESELLEF